MPTTSSCLTGTIGDATRSPCHHSLPPPHACSTTPSSSGAMRRPRRTRSDCPCTSRTSRNSGESSSTRSHSRSTWRTRPSFTPSATPSDSATRATPPCTSSTPAARRTIEGTTRTTPRCKRAATSSSMSVKPPSSSPRARRSASITSTLAFASSSIRLRTMPVDRPSSCSTTRAPT